MIFDLAFLQQLRRTIFEYFEAPKIDGKSDNKDCRHLPRSLELSFEQKFQQKGPLALLENKGL